MALSRDSKKKILEKMRNNKAKKGSGFRDPNEWRPKYDAEKDLNFRIYILPPLMKGDACLDKDNNVSECKEDWDLYYFQRGGHFINNRIVECPRVRGLGDCPLCSIGFDLMKESDDKEVRKQIAKEWLSQESRVCNIYFADHKDNPEELRGKVKYWRLPLAIFRQCEDALDRDDDGGDEDDPLAYGLFFDPEDSFPIKIVLREKAKYNNYDDSKLLGKSRAIADSEEEIEEILSKRINVPERFPDPDVSELQKIADAKMSGDTSGSSDAGFDDDDSGKNNDGNDVKESKDDDVAIKKRKKEEELRKQREAKKKRESDDETDDLGNDDNSKHDSGKQDNDDDDELDPEMADLLKELE